ncbi:MAG: uroporphyrinogen-III C-methyltransferase [Deltaproteobacteria bacterium]|nr:uroporphyrinogen-III C-methyltransferase [Deltaproteobacteria bacterium]
MTLPWVPNLFQNPCPWEHPERLFPGMVALVGAGPGDPGLLTRRGAALLAQADVVAHDALADPRLLTLAPPQAERVLVGRRTGQGGHGQAIHPLVVERARAGLRVVRLKAGDPLLFGRVGEEAEALQRAGIPFVVVPGITSAQGAAVGAGFPLTHRQTAGSVTLATGHRVEGESGAEKSPEPGQRNDWPWLAQAEGTLVLYMAARRLKAALEQLTAGGKPLATPALYAAAVTRPEQQVVRGTLADLAERVRTQLTPAQREWPALLVVGDVTAMDWRTGPPAGNPALPLWGRRVLVARSRPGTSRLAERLEALGALVWQVPQLRQHPLAEQDPNPQGGEDTGPLDRALGQAAAPSQERFDALVFACAESVGAVTSRLPTLGLDIRQLNLPVCALGDQAVAAVRAAGLLPALTTQGHCAQALEAHAGFWAGKRLLLPTAQRGRPELSAQLERQGAVCVQVAAYQLEEQFPPDQTWLGTDHGQPPLPELIVAPGSSAVRALLAGERGRLLAKVPLAAMGPRTAQAAREAGSLAVREAPHDTLNALAALAVDMLKGPS